MIEVDRKKCHMLPLVLKYGWYDLIDNGFKKVEFRRADYWLSRAQKWVRKCCKEGLQPVVEFRRGYQADAPRMAFVCGKFWSPYLKEFKNFGPPFVLRKKGDRVKHPGLGETDIDRVAFLLGERVRLMEIK